MPGGHNLPPECYSPRCPLHPTRQPVVRYSPPLDATAHPQCYSPPSMIQLTPQRYSPPLNATAHPLMLQPTPQR